MFMGYLGKKNIQQTSIQKEDTQKFTPLGNLNDFDFSVNQ
jgi:hypothetical protein